MGSSATFRFLASFLLALALSAALQAQDDYDNGNGDRGNGDRRSTWELSTSLRFRRYLEPFPRLQSARACRNRCVEDSRCRGWTYYDANFRDGGSYSYRLQRVCVMGSGVRDKQSGNRPGRTSGIVRYLHEDD
jgi:hypothetical protein